MSRDRLGDIKRICQAALDQDPHSRVAFLAEACAGDEPLRREVESLLAQEAGAERFMEMPVFDVADEGVVHAPGFAIGESIGPYRVVSWLGAGGMGAVYRARDTKLGRDVALKVLPKYCAQEPEWLARFHREAKVLASLNHPHIAAIYGFEESSLVQALVLELVEGPTLANRIAHGPIPLHEALPMAAQIVEALEAAHERGVIHRDLKPANIKLRPDGVVKVLDFGLAKSVEPTREGPASVSPSPKITLTHAGMILGTAAYMSPEQARGLAVDTRTDVWALGCVLFEMLTGRRTFGGDDVADSIAAVVTAEPEWSALPANTPAAIRRLLRRALTKDPRNRLAAASMARLEIEDALTMPEGEAPGAAVGPAERRRLRQGVAWMLIAGSVLAVAALSVPTVRYLRGQASVEPVRFLIDVPVMPDNNQVSISPDGRTVAYVARADGGKPMLHIRPIDSVDARPLAGTENAWGAFWSPDSHHLAFQIGVQPNSRLRRVETTGGPPQDIAPCGTGTWNRDGVIVCMDGGALSRVPATGGALTRITTPDASRQETAHVFPHFLPDGRHFLYLAWSSKPENRAIYLGALDSDQKTRIMTAESRAVYAPPGFLLFHRQGTLFAQAFDATHLVLHGEPVRLAEGIANGVPYAGAFAVSATGTLAYRSRVSTRERQLAWFDRQGRQLENVGSAGNGFALSPDEKRVAFTRAEPGTPGADIWTLEISTRINSRLTTDPANELEPVWSPDSQTVLFASNRMGHHAVFQRALGSRDDVAVFESKEGSQWPDDWSSDGRFILINDRNAGIVALPTTGDRTPIRLLRSDAVIDEAHFSPDGRWVAYVSTESGQAEIFVASFPEFKQIKQVSADGGNEPLWRGDGKELFYVTGDGELMAVGVSVAGSVLHTTAPQKLFATRISTGTPGVNRYAVSADGTRFLVLGARQPTGADHGDTELDEHAEVGRVTRRIRLALEGRQSPLTRWIRLVALRLFAPWALA
jgi:eukaryotic-like serine/threonine-protein kinase